MGVYIYTCGCFDLLILFYMHGIGDHGSTDRILWDFLIFGAFSWSLIRISCGGSGLDLLIPLALYTDSLDFLSP